MEKVSISPFVLLAVHLTRWLAAVGGVWSLSVSAADSAANKISAALCLRPPAPRCPCHSRCDARVRMGQEAEPEPERATTLDRTPLPALDLARTQPLPPKKPPIQPFCSPGPFVCEPLLAAPASPLALARRCARPSQRRASQGEQICRRCPRAATPSPGQPLVRSSERARVRASCLRWPPTQ